MEAEKALIDKAKQEHEAELEAQKQANIRHLEELRKK